MVSEMLLTGEEHAISSRKICELLGCNKRELTRAVEAERRKGKPICASTDRHKPGYYLAETRQEMEAYCWRLFHRAGEIHKTRKACLGCLDKLPDAEEIAEKQCNV